MKKNKLALAIIGLLSVLTLVGCSSGGTELATMKGGKITVEDFYEDIKMDQQVQGKFRDTIIFTVAAQGYGDKVDQKEIDKQFADLKEQLGENFESQLQMSGFTEETYKDALKKNLAVQEMIKSHIDIKDADLKETWKTFHPEVEVQLISMTDEAVAKETLEKVKKGDDFGKLAKEVSTDATSAENGKLKFDSTSLALPEEVKTAAYNLKDGAASELIEVSVSGSTGTTETKAYYIVKMVKNKEKGNDMKPFEKELKKIATDAKLQDATFTQEAIAKELKAANVKIKDTAMKSVLAGYIEETTETSTKDKKTETTKKSSTKEKTTDSTK